jgi:hypothetical protein
MRDPRIAVAAVVGVVWAMALTSCAHLDPRAELDPVSGFASDVYLLNGSEQPRDVTRDVCPRRPGCQKAAESDRVRIMRFDRASSAQNETYKLARSGFRSDRFVVEFLDNEITDEEWAMIASTVDHTATESAD